MINNGQIIIKHHLPLLKIVKHGIHNQPWTNILIQPWLAFHNVT